MIKGRNNFRSQIYLDSRDSQTTIEGYGDFRMNVEPGYSGVSSLRLVECTLLHQWPSCHPEFSNSTLVVVDIPVATPVYYTLDLTNHIYENAGSAQFEELETLLNTTLNNGTFSITYSAITNKINISRAGGNGNEFTLAFSLSSTNCAQLFGFDNEDVESSGNVLTSTTTPFLSPIDYVTIHLTSIDLGTNNSKYGTKAANILGKLPRITRPGQVVTYNQMYFSKCFTRTSYLSEINIQLVTPQGTLLPCTKGVEERAFSCVLELEYRSI